jgi:hypothetical protein
MPYCTRCVASSAPTGSLGLFGVDEYRGLRPGSKLVMTLEREAFELAFKHRELDSGPEVPGL